MKKNLLMAAIVLVGLGALTAPASAAITQCDYSKTYDDSRTIYVARDGSGAYNCDGVDDQVEINQAFQAVQESNGAYTSVFLKTGTYIIGSTVQMVDGSILEGDRDAILKLKDQADWTVNVPMIGSAGTPSNIEIKCFEADVNYSGNYSADAYACMAGSRTCAKNDYACCEAYSTYRTTGKGYYNVAGFTYGSGYSMHDMYLHDGLNDGLNVLYGSGIRFYDNTVYKLGHEGLYVKYSDTAEAYGNTITNRTNSGLRADDTNHVSFHDNDITAFDNWSAGGPGIEIVKDDRSTNIMDDIQIFNNHIHGTYGPGIWITASGTSYGPGETAARIHHNVFSGTGINPSINWTAGIITSGFYDLQIENNVFDKVYNGALIVSNAVNTAPAASGYATIFRNNIVTGTQPQRNTVSQGYGIINLLSGTHAVSSENNCFFANYAGDYSGAVSISGDIYADPLYADASNGDYHLQSTAGRFDPAAGLWVTDGQDSPCIDSGSLVLDYSQEPDYNGGRINIGRYGNTAEASKSVEAFNHPLAVDGGNGSGSYLAGTVVEIIADVPAAGKAFDRWTGDVSYVSDPYAATTTVTMPAQAVSITATYKDVYYPLAVNSGEGSGSYTYGYQAVITASAPAAGQAFDRWTGDVACVSDIYSPVAVVTMPAGPVSITATYKTAYYLNVVYGTGDGYYANGAKATIIADAPAAGKVFSKWVGDTAYVSNIYSSTAVVTMPGKAIKLTAYYKAAPTHYLTVNYGSGDGYYYAGKVVTIKANAPAAGKVFDKWIGDTAYVTDIYAATTTVNMPNIKITLTATYRSATAS